MHKPNQAHPAVPVPTESDFASAYRAARAVRLAALCFAIEEPHDTNDPLPSQGASRLRAERIAQAYEAFEGRAAAINARLFEWVSLLYPPGIPPLPVAGEPHPSILEGLFSEVRNSLDFATHPARVACMDRPEGESMADWVRASWPNQSPEAEEANYARLVAAMRAIATPQLRCELERERRHLAARFARAAKPKGSNSARADESGDDPDYQPAVAFEEDMRPRLRQASRKGRRSKRVRSTLVDGVRMYSRADAKRWWPKDFG
jgi:hypothetical protein